MAGLEWSQQLNTMTNLPVLVVKHIGIDRIQDGRSIMMPVSIFPVQSSSIVSVNASV
jgi:hypothetical protein